MVMPCTPARSEMAEAVDFFVSPTMADPDRRRTAASRLRHASRSLVVSAMAFSRARPIMVHRLLSPQSRFVSASRMLSPSNSSRYRPLFDVPALTGLSSTHSQSVRESPMMFSKQALTEAMGSVSCSQGLHGYDPPLAVPCARHWQFSPR